MSNLQEQGKKIAEDVGKCTGCFHYWEEWDAPGADCYHPFVSLIDDEWPEEWGNKEICPLWSTAYTYCGYHNDLYHQSSGICPACENDELQKIHEADQAANNYT